LVALRFAGPVPFFANKSLTEPALHFTARADRIVPAASAPPGPSHAVSAGHVGMIVGSSAPEQLHRPLLDFLT